MEEEIQVPNGYTLLGNGTMVPTSSILEVDKERSLVVEKLCLAAQKQSRDLTMFKAESMTTVQEFVRASLETYGVAHGGKKGNITLNTLDGKYRVVRSIQESIVFDERVQAAKALIDECIQLWSKGSNDHIKALVMKAFNVDKANKINTNEVLSLRTLDIKDDKWKLAMEAISASIQVTSTKPFIRFYQRDDVSGEYKAISLDLATL